MPKTCHVFKTSSVQKKNMKFVKRNLHDAERVWSVESYTKRSGKGSLIVNMSIGVGGVPNLQAISPRVTLTGTQQYAVITFYQSNLPRQSASQFFGQ